MGKAIKECLIAHKHEPVMLIDSHEIIIQGQLPRPLQDLGKCVDQVDVGFLAISTLDNGEQAAGYIDQFLKKNRPIVTCEKGALANEFRIFQDDLDMIGYTATVGGASGIIPFAAHHITDETTEIHMIVNGTANYVLHRASEGATLEEALREARTLGYTEPQSDNVKSGIWHEIASDITGKVAIFNNVLFGEKILHGYELAPEQLHDGKIAKLQREAEHWRYIVSFTREKKEAEAIASFAFRVPGWHCFAGFRNLDEHPLFRQYLALRGMKNAILIIEEKDDVLHYTKGPGAGPERVAKVMLEDAEKLVPE